MVAIVVHRCERAKLANRWSATAGGHGLLSSLFDVHTRLSHDLFLSLMAYLGWHNSESQNSQFDSSINAKP
jgi:hypothetical protein